MFCRNYGFTLMELTLVTAIMAISLGLAIPHLGSFISNQRLKAAAQTLQLDLMHARARAISDHRTTVMCPSAAGQYCDDTAAWHSGWISFHDQNRDRERQENEQLVRVTSALVGVKANSSNFRKRVRFLANGTAAGTAMTISVCPENSSDFARTLVIANSGRIRQQRLSGTTAVVQCAAWN